MTLFPSLELGDFRIGLKFQDSSGRWIDAWFEGNTKEMLPPASHPELFHPTPPYAGFVIEATIAHPDDTIYVYFGKPLEPFDGDMAIKLSKNTVSSPGYTRWTSDDTQQTDESFYNFVANYWGVANLVLHILNKIKLPFFERLDIIFSRVLSVGFDPWRTQVYNDIFKNLSQLGEKSNVTAPLQTFGTLVETILRVPFEDKAHSSLEQYYLLEAFFDHYLAMVRAICQRPSSKIQKHLTFQQVAEEDSSLLDLSMSATEIIAIESYRLGGRRISPLAFWGSSAFENFDIPENRFLLYSAMVIDKMLNHVLTSINAYIQTKADVRSEFLRMRRGHDSSLHFTKIEKDISDHKLAQNQLARKRIALEGLVRTFQRQYNIRQGFNEGYESEILYYDGRYSQFRALHYFFLRSMSTTSISKEKMPFQVSAFNQLYQHWVLLCVLDALQNPAIGFVMQAQGLHDPFYERPLENAILCQLTHPKFPGLKVDLWNERRYELYTERSSTSANYGYMDVTRKRGSGDGKMKLRPDISLEFWHNSFKAGRFPQIITLDPTINRGSQQSLDPKYLYLDNIRCFDASEDYPNGQALHLVKAAWAIFPGRNRRQLAIEPMGSSRRSQEEEFSFGNLCLFPGNQNHLISSLKDILQYTILDALGLTI